METAAEIAKHFIPCTCDEAYVLRRMIAPDCPLHAFDIESSMEEYARRVAIDFLKWYTDNHHCNPEALFEMYLKEKSMKNQTE